MKQLPGLRAPFRPARRGFLSGLASAAALPLAPLALAQPPQRFAVLSLVGDRLEIVTRADATGSHIDRDGRQVVALTGDTLDRRAAARLDEVLESHGAAGNTLLLARDRTLAAVQDRLLDPAASAPEVQEARQALVELLASTPATRLLLLTRHPGEARFEVPNGRSGRGQVAGLGYYVDKQIWLKDPATGRYADGFVASFASVRLQLVDVKTLQVLAQAQAIEHSTVTAAGSPEEERPWMKLGRPERVMELDRLLRQAASAAAEELMSRLPS